MTVFKNKQRNGEWRFDFRLGGRRYHGPCIVAEGRPAANRREALEAEGVHRRRVRGDNNAPRPATRPGAYSFGQAVLARIRRQVGRSPLHVANLMLYGRDLLAHFGDATPIGDIGQAEVDAYRVKAAVAMVSVWRGGPRRRDKVSGKTGTLDRKRSPASINHRLNFLRSVLGQAHATRDPVTGRPLLEHPPKVEPVPEAKRQPRPMPDAELYARLETAPPWVQEAGELVRYFGLRRAEVLGVELANVDKGRRALRFDGAATKSGRDEFAYPLPGGWEFLDRLAKQARRRGQTRLITWPGPAYMAAAAAGLPVPRDCWRPLKSIRRAWRSTVRKAGVDHPHRFHDVRARYITDIATHHRGLAKEAARHADPATTERYISIASTTVAAALKTLPAPKKPAYRTIRGGR